MAKPRSPRGLILQPTVLPASDSPFEPTRLDPIVQESVRQLEDANADWARLQPLVKEFFEGFKAVVDEQRAGTLKVGQAHQAMQSLTTLLERQSRIMMNMAKACDIVARLRQFLAGGSVGPPELVEMSDQQLEELVMKMAGTIRPEVVA